MGIPVTHFPQGMKFLITLRKLFSLDPHTEKKLFENFDFFPFVG